MADSSTPQGRGRGEGLSLFEKDAGLCFPLLLRVDPKDTAVKIGRTLERRIRPSELARR